MTGPGGRWGKALGEGEGKISSGSFTHDSDMAEEGISSGVRVQHHIAPPRSTIMGISETVFRVGHIATEKTQTVFLRRYSSPTRKDPHTNMQTNFPKCGHIFINS